MPAFNGHVLPTTQKAVLEAFVAKLIQDVPGLDAHTCFVTDEPMPENLPSVAPLRLATVCIAPSRFDEAAFDGAGFHDLAERFRVMVTLFQHDHSDQIGHAASALLDEQRGMITVFKFDVLRALQVDESSGTPVQWMPTDDDGNGLLRDHPMPITATEPRKTKLGEGGLPFVMMGIDFDAFMSWRLVE